MKDYSKYAVCEAVNEEMLEQFIKTIKLMDAEKAQKRLTCLLNSNGPNVSVISLLGQFLIIKDCKTSADY